MFATVRIGTILSVVLIGSLAAFGCGGSDSGSEPAATETTGTTSAAPEITMAELITLGDGICAEVNAAVGTITASDSADPAVVETQVSDIYSGMADRLAELGTPSDGAAPTEVIDAARALADSGATDGSTALADFQSAATAYGFTDCAEAPAAPSGSTAGSTGVPADGSGTGGSVEPAPAPAPAPPPPPAPATPGTGGGVAPSTGGGSGGSGSSSGSGSSGGISPG